MRAVALTLVFSSVAWADVAVPMPAAKTWRDGCAARIDEAAKKAGLPPGAHSRVIRLLHEDGTPNPVQYVEYATPKISVTVGEDAEPHPDTLTTSYSLDGSTTWFRRLHNRFSKITFAYKSPGADQLRAGVDECLKMGELK